MSSPQTKTGSKEGEPNAKNKSPTAEEATPPFSSSCNPVLSDGDDQTDALERIRGDAIGDTMYSERYVLSTLLQLTKDHKDLSQAEEFEKELCSLWDMTIEEDVVKLLLKHNVMELFAQCIDATTDKRLTEILIGIMGNMCNLQAAREALSANAAAVATLLGLVGCSDSLTLLQLMRLLSVILIHANEADTLVWYKHVCATPNFVQDVGFILNNCMNTALLRQTLETLNAILAKFALVDAEELHSKERPFHEVFVDETLVKGTAEAFEVLLPKQKMAVAADDDAILPSLNTRNMMQIFLNIHSILTQFHTLSHACYAPHLLAVVNCMNRILEPLCNTVYLPHMSSHEQDMLDSINDIFKALNDPFDEGCLSRMVTLWDILRQEAELRAGSSPPTNAFEEDETTRPDFGYEECYLIALDFITRQAQQATVEQLEGVLKVTSAESIENLLCTLTAGDIEDHMRLSFEKFQSAVENLTDKKNK